MDEIRNILQFMEEKRLVEFEYEEEGRRIRLRRAEDRAVTAPTAAAAREPSPAVPAAPPEPESTALPARPDNVIEFRSPLVGTFYRAAKPDADPFVNVGDEVTPDKVICIIEAMKVLNEIKAEMNGIVREILVKNSQAVEYGEPLFLIEKK